MTTLLELNNFSDGTFTYTDNRPSDVLFSFPTARDVNKTITTKSFPAEGLIDIVEIVKPVEARASFSIDVSSITGATVNWSVIPSGCTVSVYNSVYTIDGIDSVDIWNQVKAPTITLPTTFFGSFFYISTINYINSGTPKSKQWQVGLYVPESELQAVTSVVCNASKVFGSEQLIFPMAATFTPVIQDLAFVARASITAQFTAGYFSPAATLNTLSTISEGGQVTPQPLQPYLSASNPNDNTTDTTDHFVTDIDMDDTYVIVGARAEDTASESDAGIAYVFNKSTGVLVYTLDNPNPGPTVDYFGSSVAITDNYFVVGAPQEQNDSFADGSVYAFNKSDGTLENTIDNTVTGNTQLFGLNVKTIDFDNDIVAVTSAGENAVYYNVDCDAGTIGSSVTQTDLVDTTNIDNNELDANNGWFIAGSPAQDTAYVYEGSSLRHTKTVSTSASGNSGFGSSVAISNTYFAVAAWGENSGEGKVWIYNKSTGNLIGSIDNPDLSAPVSPSQTTSFGKFMYMTDDYLFVSTHESVKTNVNGRVFIFDPSDATAITGKKVYPPDTLSSEATPPSYYPYFGNIFAFDGTDKLVVGDRQTEKGTKIYWYDIG